MKLIITVQQADIQSPPDPRFGRAQFFLSVDTETREWQAYPNTSTQQAHGAGIAAAQWVNDHGAKAVVSGDFGPNAARVLQAAGVELYLFDAEPTAEAVLQNYLSDQLKQF